MVGCGLYGEWSAQPPGDVDLFSIDVMDTVGSDITAKLK